MLQKQVLARKRGNQSKKKHKCGARDEGTKKKSDGSGLLRFFSASRGGKKTHSEALVEEGHVSFGPSYDYTYKPREGSGVESECEAKAPRGLQSEIRDPHM